MLTPSIGRHCQRMERFPRLRLHGENDVAACKEAHVNAEPASSIEGGGEGLRTLTSGLSRSSDSDLPSGADQWLAVSQYAAASPMRAPFAGYSGAQSP
jgi:hypothetical protein